MLGNYFRELLEKHNRVIIPDFGAFLVKDTGDTRSLANISFSPFLRYNDGLVEVFLAEKEGLTKAEATNQVKAYVDSLKTQLDNGVQVELLKLGYFYKDARDTIQFQLNLTEESPKPFIKEQTEPITVAVNSKTTATPILEEQQPKLAEEIPVSQENNEVEKIILEPLKQDVPVEEQTALKQPTKPIIVEKKTKVTVIQKKTKPVSTPTNQPMEQTLNKKSSKSKSSKGYWLLILGLIVLLLVIIWQYDNILKSVNTNGKTIIDNTATMTDSLSADSDKANKDSIANSTTATAPVYVKPVIDKPENKYLVVVGSFTNQANAESQLKKLIDQGYQPIIILRSNGMHSVVISGHTTKAEAQLSLEGYKKKNGDGWIMSR